jgi:molybdate transport system substrate-binding protein
MMTFGHGTNLAEAERIVNTAFDVEVTFFDTANGYSDSESETMLDKALGAQRRRAAIAPPTKAGQMEGALKVAAMVVSAIILLLNPAAAESLKIYAAGSLTEAFTQMIREFPAPAGAVSPPVFGPSGVLRDRIERGEPADILASADMMQPRKLARAGEPVILFTRNRICALGRESVRLTADTLLDRMLDPAVRLATSTPGADPSGDYAWAIFARAEAVRPGARAILQAKALQLVGGSATPPLVAGHGAVQGVFLADRADVMLSYCSGSAPVMKEVPGLVSLAVPAALSVGPSYGMVVLSDHPLAMRFALFVMSEQGQSILQRHGFDPVGLAAP